MNEQAPFPTLDILLERWLVLDKQERVLRERLLELEHSIQVRMETDGATEVAHPLVLCVLKPAPGRWDYSVLRPLLELVPAEELSKGYTTAHAEMVDVPDKWDMRRVLTWAKYGGQVKDIIERAKVPGRATLMLASKERKTQ